MRLSTSRDTFARTLLPSLLSNWKNLCSALFTYDRPLFARLVPFADIAPARNIPHNNKSQSNSTEIIDRARSATSITTRLVEKRNRSSRNKQLRHEVDDHAERNRSQKAARKSRGRPNLMSANILQDRDTHNCIQFLKFYQNSSF